MTIAGNTQNPKLDGKTVSPENLEMLGQATTSDQIKGTLTLTAVAPLVLPEDDTEVREHPEASELNLVMSFSLFSVT